MVRQMAYKNFSTLCTELFFVHPLDWTAWVDGMQCRGERKLSLIRALPIGKFRFLIPTIMVNPPNARGRALSEHLMAPRHYENFGYFSCAPCIGIICNDEPRVGSKNVGAYVQGGDDRHWLYGTLTFYS